MSSSSSNHSTTIPLSFDRFRVTSIRFLSPFRYHHSDRRIKQISERSYIRKSQVHPNVVKSSKSEQIDHDAAHLFHANKHLNSKTSSLSKTSQDKKCAKNCFNIRSTSNVTSLLDVGKLPVTDAFHPSQLDAFGRKYPPTPCMIGYRHRSLPNLIPTHVVKHPKSSYDSNFDQFNT